MCGYPSDVLGWTPQEVAQWLDGKGHQTYSKLLCDQHKLDGVGLLSLTESDLRSPPISIPVLGDIKRIIHEIEILKTEHAVALKYVKYNKEKVSSQQFLHEVVKEEVEYPDRSTKRKRLVLVKEIFTMTPENLNIQKYFQPELVKTLVALLYLVVVTWLLSFIMVIVHDRVPDMKKYPPLPDIFLDNVPLIPWAFAMSEICGTVLMATWIITCIFHKHRTILMRRFFALLGTAYLLRSITMLITSLSVPGPHLACASKSNNERTFSEKIYDAYVIWKSGGLSIQGVKTCGDYLFSGHTTTVTFLNFFITEYTPNKYKILHVFSWLINVLAIVCILASHEHYSIDVFIGFYITSRLFLYYHSLANNQALIQDDRHRVRIWFPFFGYLESSMMTRVPNEFATPMDLVRCIVNAIKALKTRLFK